VETVGCETGSECKTSCDAKCEFESENERENEVASCENARAREEDGKPGPRTKTGGK